MKSVLKKTANLLATLVVVPVVLAYRLGAYLAGTEKAFPGWSQLFSLIPGLSGAYFRRAFYRWVLPRYGNRTDISFGTILSHPTASIGDNVYVGAYCSLGSVTIEDDVLIASHVSIMNGFEQHSIDRLDVPIREQPGRYVPVTIGQDSWIGERAVVAADIGEHCVIGAGAVVTKPIPDYAVAVGVPARVVRFRGHGENVTVSATLEQAEQLLHSVL